ncbi:MAG: flagellar assembly protein FliW [Ruminococcaceae bacterium]|nr:flagellar assembly protein FliW [Oscillospiraceae bacterium]
MTIETRDFGSMELDEGALVEFRAPIFGFDNLSRFVMLSDDETGPGLLWLQSLEDPDVCFILLDPEELGGVDYKPEIGRATADLLQLDADAPIVRVIAVVPANFQEATVNLKSPIIINPKNKWAAQTILDADYPIRMPLFDKEAAEC